MPMTALRCIPLVGIAAVTVLVAVSAALASACTSGTTPTCDDAGTCLILTNPTDGTISNGIDAFLPEDSGGHDGAGSSDGHRDGPTD
jgi:hypothetical protein